MSTQEKLLIALDKVTSEQYSFTQTESNTVYKYNSKDLKTNLERTADGLIKMTVNGVSYPVELLSHNQNEYELLVNGVSYSFSIETPFSIERNKLVHTLMNESTIIRLKAPMPGKILDVFVKTGDSVKAGDTLLVLEAMKMQNAILASTKGIIKKVLVKAGDATSKSDLLIEMEKD